MTEIVVNISLRVWHPGVAASAVVEAFRLPVEVSHSVNEPRVSPNGRSIGGCYERTYVSMSMARRKPVELDEELRHCYEVISGSAEFISTLVESGGELEFYVSAFLTDPCGFSFDHEFMAAFAKTGLGVSVELYPEPGSGY